MIVMTLLLDVSVKIMIMNKEKLNELQVILDSFEYEIADLKSAIYKIEDKILSLKEIINPKEEEF